MAHPNRAANFLRVPRSDAETITCLRAGEDIPNIHRYVPKPDQCWAVVHGIRWCRATVAAETSFCAAHGRAMRERDSG